MANESVDLGALPVVHDEKAHRFHLQVNGQSALLTYRLSGDRIVFDHTEVPLEFEGRGLASKLVEAGLEYARSKQWRVVPLCPFVAAYIQKHPEFKNLLAR